MARTPNKTPKDWSNWIIAAIAFVSFGGAKIYDSFNYKETLATKPYVDTRIDETKRYSEELSSRTLKEAFEHSDTNKQAMLLRMEQMNTESKTSQATFAAKIDSLIDLVHKMRDDAWEVMRSKQKK